MKSIHKTIAYTILFAFLLTGAMFYHATDELTGEELWLDVVFTATFFVLHRAWNIPAPRNAAKGVK